MVDKANLKFDRLRTGKGGGVCERVRYLLSLNIYICALCTLHKLDKSILAKNVNITQNIALSALVGGSTFVTLAIIYSDFIKLS